MIEHNNIKVLLCIALLVQFLVACTGAPIKSPSRSKLFLEQKEEQNVLYLQGKSLFLSKQYSAAAATLLPLARQGHLGAQYTIGYMYHYGYGVPRNEKESVRWIATAAGRGHPQAKEALARINASHDARGVISAPVSQP